MLVYQTKNKQKKGWGWGGRDSFSGQLWGDTGGGGSGEGERGPLFQVGVKPGLEAVHGVSRHDFLRQTVPVW